MLMKNVFLFSSDNYNKPNTQSTDLPGFTFPNQPNVDFMNSNTSYSHVLFNGTKTIRRNLVLVRDGCKSDKNKAYQVCCFFAFSDSPSPNPTNSTPALHFGGARGTSLHLSYDKSNWLSLSIAHLLWFFFCHWASSDFHPIHFHILTFLSMPNNKY